METGEKWIKCLNKVYLRRLLNGEESENVVVVGIKSTTMSFGLHRTSTMLSLLSYKQDFVPAEEGLKNACPAENVPLTKIVATVGPSTSTEEALSLLHKYIV